MNNDQSNPKNTKTKFDLADRTFNFGVNIINFAKTLPADNINRPIVNQLVRSGTSIGANYSEADEANSKKDFINKIVIAKKEAKETKYWLRLVISTLEQFKPTASDLFREAQELTLIFSAIVRNSKK
jgi:four helix bundle protein